MSDNKPKMQKSAIWLVILVAIVVGLYYAFQMPIEPTNSGTTTSISEQQVGTHTSAKAAPNNPTSQANNPTSQTADQGTTSLPTSPLTGVEGVVFGQKYSTEEDVALYLELFEELPPNYLTKAQAYTLGWVPEEGNLWKVTDEMSIGGDEFGNREGLLPEGTGRQYYEADVNYYGGPRNAERLVYSSDGLIYYTNDHYQSFTKLYD